MSRPLRTHQAQLAAIVRAIAAGQADDVTDIRRLNLHGRGRAALAGVATSVLGRRLTRLQKRLACSSRAGPPAWPGAYSGRESLLRDYRDVLGRNADAEQAVRDKAANLTGMVAAVLLVGMGLPDCLVAFGGGFIEGGGGEQGPARGRREWLPALSNQGQIPRSICTGRKPLREPNGRWMSAPAYRRHRRQRLTEQC